MSILIQTNMMIMRQIMITLSVLFAITFSAYGQSTTGIEGKVIDQQSGETLFGATVRVGEEGVTSNLDGNFTIELSAGNYTVEISHVGYDIWSEEILVKENETTSINCELVSTNTVLQTAVVTGSVHEKSIAESTVSINVLKPNLIENTNTIRVTSVLDKVPGVQLIDNQANIRGGSGWSYGAGSRVLLLIDDIPALQGDAGRPSWTDIPVENISQIEVLKGASSTLYGSSAMNGIINIKTGYATSKPQTKAYISYGQFLSPQDEDKKWWSDNWGGDAPYRFSTGLVHKRKIGKLDLVMHGFHEDFSSYYKDSFEKKYRFSANAKYRLTDRIHFGLNTMFNTGENQNPFLWEKGDSRAYFALPGSLITNKNTRYYIDPQLTIFDKKQNRHKVFGRYYYINNDNSTNQSNSSKSTYLEYQFLKSLDNIGLDVTSGASTYLVTSNSELFGDVQLTSNNYAIYTELDKKIGDKICATVGLRYEYNYQGSPEVFKGDTIPNGHVDESKLIARAGLNYQLSDGTYVRASWGQGYRFPTITERFIETAISGFFIFPNVRLGSESGWTSEIGIKQGFRVGTWQGYIDLATFWSQYDNMTEFTFVSEDGKNGFQSQNIGATDIKGYEITLIGQSKLFGSDLNIMAGYTYINPQYQDFDNNEAILNSISTPVGKSEKENILKYRNRHNFKADVETTIYGVSLGAAFNYTSATETIDELLNNIGFIGFYRGVNSGGFTKLDGRLSYDFGALKVGVVGENLLNTEYTLRPGLLEAPRNISLRVDMSL